LEGRLKFNNCYYDSKSADLPADVVICRHVIEHITQPIEFLREIKKALTNSPQARLFFETPCVEWSLKNQVFWDFFYEHCSYFTSNSLTTAFQVAGFQVDQVKYLFGNQILWLEASIPQQSPVVTKEIGSISYLAQHFSQKESEFQEKWRIKLKELVSKGEKIAIWGAAGKGTTFVNLIDPQTQWISCAVDINPKKQGKFMVGTGLPIISPQQLKEFGITDAIVVNPNYTEEITNLLRKAGLNIGLLSAIM
jgi:hypothetical protein